MPQKRVRIVLMGDVNAHGILWGSPKNDKRGNILTEFMNKRELASHDLGDPTWRNVRYATHIDVTLTNAKLQGRIGKWKSEFKIANTDHAVCSIEAK